SRIVVLGTGKNIEDSYIKGGYRRIGPKSFSTEQMPPTNLDLVMNSVHWARGQEKWIAAGPAVAPAIQAIPKGTMRLVQLVLWALAPLLASVPAVWAWGVPRR